MATLRTIIKGAHRLINNIAVSEELSADEMNISLEALNCLVDSYANNIQNIYTMSPYYFQLTAGVGAYTLGPATGEDGQALNPMWQIERPMRVEKMNLLQGWAGEFTPDTLTIAMSMISYREFGDLRMRGMTGPYPRFAYDSGNYPLRTINLWPIPTENLWVELWLWQPLINWADVDQELNLPPGYERLLRFNLACEIAPEFLKEVPPVVRTTAAEALMEVQRLNQQHPKTRSSGLLQSTDNRFNTAPGYNGRGR